MMLRRTETIRRSVAAHFPRRVFAWSSELSLNRAGLRRFIATFIVVLIGGFYASPFVQSASGDPEANLPACCRRHGGHHCAMHDQTMRSVSPGGTQISAIPQHCPLYPHASTAPVTRSHAGLAPSAALFAQILSHPAVHPQIQAVYRLSLDRSRQKRGPPALQIL